MSTSKLFADINEPFGEGYFESEERSSFYRIACGWAKYLESLPMKEYEGGSFYPCTSVSRYDFAICPHIALAFDVDYNCLSNKSEEAAKLLREATKDFSRNPTMHTVAGWCFTHSMPNYTRIAREGLASYRERVKRVKDEEFREGLLKVLSSIEAYRDRCVEFLISCGAKAQLISALKKVPFEPCESIYEAMVCRNFIFCLDNCDNYGRLDADLLPYYKGENIDGYLCELFEIIDRNDGFSCAIGPEYSEVTLACLRAIKNKRRPSLELRIKKDMPQEFWDAAEEAIRLGSTNPSLYNEDGFYNAFRSYYPDMPYEDYFMWCGAGCTEMSIAGMCNAGSLDAGMNLLKLFSIYTNEALSRVNGFDEFYSGYMKLYRDEWRETEERLRIDKEICALYRPSPIRTLFTDDCIDNEKNFNAGGARYNWSVINFSGIVNVIDSMLAVKQLVFDEKRYSANDFTRLLSENDKAFLEVCKACRHMGQNDEEVIEFAKKFTGELYSELEKYENYLGGKYLPSSIQFMTCAMTGMDIPATPDGRESGSPVADSLSALSGKKNSGLTSVLLDAAVLNQNRMIGTPVMNLKLSKACLNGKLRGVVLGYFESGGMQLQINCLSREDMLAALDDPENHRELIVRVGGYSEYFVRLSKELQNQIIARTEFM